jgi:signal transduction histidine kinase
MSRGGVLRVGTRVRADDGRVQLEVQDHGEGIPMSVLPNIFDPFFTTKGEGQGVGLGLAVVYGIVEAHRGEIEVVGAENGGTIFRITLPVFDGGVDAGDRGGGEAS